MEYAVIDGPHVDISYRESDGAPALVSMWVTWSALGNWTGGACHKGEPGWFIFAPAPSVGDFVLNPFQDGPIDTSLWDGVNIISYLGIGAGWPSEAFLCGGAEIPTPSYDVSLDGDGYSHNYSVEAAPPYTPPITAQVPGPVTLFAWTIDVTYNMNCVSGYAGASFQPLTMTGDLFLPAPPNRIDPPRPPIQPFSIGPCSSIKPFYELTAPADG